MGLILYITRFAECRRNTICLVIFPHSECRGDLTVYSTSSRIVQRTLDWGRHREWSFAPFTVLDVGNPSYWDVLLPIFVEVMADRVACVAFPAEAAAEMHDERGSTLVDPGNDAMQVPLDEDLREAVDREKDLLDAMPLPGTPQLMKQSADVLGLHYHGFAYRHTGGCIDSLDTHPQLFCYKSCVQLGLFPSTFRHADIFDLMPVKTTNPNINLPRWLFQKDYVFGRNLGIDVLVIKDVADEPYLCLNILDLGTTFQEVVLLRQGHGSPSSRECLDSFVSLWIGWAGWPQTLSCDRGVHNRCVFARTFAQHGILIRQAGVESREQIGRVERHGQLFKAVLKRMITEHAVRGFDDKNRDR